jgi:membrane protease YdiL (CAAX protease family)
MNKFKQLASNSPVTFGLVITLTFIVLIIISAVFANRWEAETQNWYIANTVGRLAAIAILVVLVTGLGWLKPAGFTRPGRWQIWLLAPILLVYGVIASSYALTGSVALNIPGSAILSAMGLFLMSHALYEEVTFRGLVLPAFLNRSGGTTWAIIKAIAVSSIFFAAMHFLNVLGGNPLPVVMLQAVGGYFLGIFFGGLVVSGRSIYPAVLLHGLMNIAAQLSLLANSSAADDPSAWLWQTILMIPLAVVGLYLIWTTARQPTFQMAFKQPKLADN